MGRTLIGGFVVVCASAAHADCPPAAVSSGDPALVRALGERLAASGVATTSMEGCPVVRVRVEQRGDAVHLEMSDAFSRTGQRQVRDVATAAAVVESWTRHEVEEGLLPELAAASITTDAPPSASSARSPSGIGIAFESSVGDDRSLWLGAAASGCFAIGPACVGGIVRGARDTRATGDMAGGEHRGSELHANATVDLPRRLGAFTISPGIGAGYGLSNLTATHLDMHMMQFEVSRTSHALRGELHVSIVRPLGSSFALYGDLRGDTAIARTEAQAGPRSFVRAAVGIRFGVP